MYFLEKIKNRYALNFQKAQILDEIRHLTETVQSFINGKQRSEQIVILDYIIKSLIDDACASKIVEPLIKPTEGVLDEPLPLFYYDENGNSQSIYTSRKTSVDIAASNIYVRPWSIDKTLDSLLNLSDKKFIYKSNNHFSYYYTDIDLCYVHNGNHSINAGRYYKKGTILSDEANTSLLYPHINTDGVYWYNSHTNQVIYSVSDFRFAAVFLVAKMKNELKKS